MKMSLQKDLLVVELPSHAKALDKALKVEWVREHIGNEQKSGEKKRLLQNNSQNCQGNKKRRWIQNKSKRNDKPKKRCE